MAAEPKRGQGKAPSSESFGLPDRARMLISLLGPDFERNNGNPFFRRLAEAASKSSEPPEPGELTQSLSSLLKQLEKPLPVQPAVNHKSKNLALSAKGQAKRTKPGKELVQNLNAPTVGEHPAIIARRIAILPLEERKKILRKLPGRIARLTTTYLVEIQKKSARKTAQN